MKNVVIIMRGGVVQDVISDSTNIQIFIVDHDEIAEGQYDVEPELIKYSSPVYKALTGIKTEVFENLIQKI